jgi:flagellar hook-basal body complex protein FliE
MTAIDTTQIDSMIAQIRSSVSNIKTPSVSNAVTGNDSAQAVDFSSVFKDQLNQLNQSQVNAQQLGQRFTLGDDSVGLSDVMISSQKVGIAMQTAVQVRNKLLTSYQTIMNMQV